MQTDHSNEGRPTVWFIRHGESEAYTGKAAAHSEEVRLTEAGKRQAEEIAGMLPRAPDLIICSSYLRAWETALPTIELFPSSPHKIWPVQEFTYLGSLAGVSTTKAERRSQVEAYWNRCDPTYRDGNGESFEQLILRARTIIKELKQQRGFIVVFTHEQFIRAIQGLLYGWLESSAKHMRQFRQRLLKEPLHYGYILDMPICPDGDSGPERFFQREYLQRSLLLTSHRE